MAVEATAVVMQEREEVMRVRRVQGATACDDSLHTRDRASGASDDGSSDTRCGVATQGQRDRTSEHQHVSVQPCDHDAHRTLQVPAHYPPRRGMMKGVRDSQIDRR